MRAKPAFQVLAIVSSLILVTGFVYYKAAPSRAPASRHVGPPTAALDPVGEHDRMLLGGTKSMAVFTPESQPADHMLPTSKSGRVFTPDDVAPAVSESQPAQDESPKPE